MPRRLGLSRAWAIGFRGLGLRAFGLLGAIGFRGFRVQSIRAYRAYRVKSLGL